MYEFYFMCIGMFIGAVFHVMIMHSYKQILVSKARNKEVECINGNFYRIVEEDI